MEGHLQSFPSIAGVPAGCKSWERSPDPEWTPNHPQQIDSSCVVCIYKSKAWKPEWFQDPENCQLILAIIFVNIGF
jgi:hypothetical protein